MIIIKNPKADLDRFLDNGFLTFDLTKDFDLGTTLTGDALSDLLTFSDNYTVASSLPSTPKNDAIFTAYKGEKVPISITGEHGFLPYKHLEFQTLSDNKSPSFEILFISENPLIALKEQKINELDFGNFDFSQSNILAHFENDVSNMSVPFYHPVCDYGKFTDTTPGIKAVKMQDLRTWLREYSILKKMFQKIGWTFKSPIHETNFGRKIGCYLNDSFTKATTLDKFGFKATVTNVFRIVSHAPLEEAIKNLSTEATGGGYDNGANTGGYFSTSTQTWGGLSGNYTLKIRIAGQYFFNNDRRLRLYLRRNGIDNFAENQTVYISTLTDFQTIELKITDASPTDYFTLIIYPEGNVNLVNYVDIAKDSTIELQATKIELKAGLYESINKYIDETHKSIDFFKGVVHWCNGQLDINYIKKTVTMYPPQSLLNIFETGEDVKGYYLDTQIDLRPYQLKYTSKYDFRKADNGRYFSLKYKRSEDEYIKDKDLFSKTFDFGNAYPNKTTISENPFFEPTAQTTNHSLSDVKFPIPVLWDNTDGNLSNSINPRRCIFENRLPSGTDGTTSFWTFESTPVSTFFPTCYMKAETSYNGLEVKESLSFDIWGDLVYYSEIQSQYENGLFEAIFYISPVLFETLNFRAKYMVIYEGNVKAVRLQRVNDFKVTKELPTPLKFKV